MTAEEAIKTAIKYEKKVFQTYIDAVRDAGEEGAKKFFQLMAEEEKSHVDYLEAALAKWQQEGKIDSCELGTAIPDAGLIAEGYARLKGEMAGKDTDECFGSDITALRKALDAEEETSAFYRKMVDELTDDARKLFRRFLEIEDGHRAIVEAELDATEQNGFWFDCREFNQELD